MSIQILIDGADRARAIADETMSAAKDIVGFIREVADADSSEPKIAKSNPIAK